MTPEEEAVINAAAELVARIDMDYMSHDTIVETIACLRNDSQGIVEVHPLRLINLIEALNAAGRGPDWWVPEYPPER